LHGFKRREGLPFRWTLFDGTTKMRLAESEDIDPLPGLTLLAKTQGDLGSWELWVNTTLMKAEKYFVRVEVYNPEGNHRVTYEDSPVFSSAVH
jgi:hypothetical protein